MAAPNVMVVESVRVQLRIKCKAVSEANAVPIVVPRENAVMHINISDVPFKVLISDDVNVIQQIHESHNHVYILGIVTNSPTHSVAPREYAVMHINNSDVPFKVLISDDVNVIQQIHESHNHVYILGIVTASNDEGELMAAGATECVGEFVTTKIMKRIIGNLPPDEPAAGV